MNLILTIILCIIINYVSKFIIEKGKELIEIIKIRKSLKNFENLRIDNLDNEFWEDLKDEDISTE